MSKANKKNKRVKRADQIGRNTVAIAAHFRQAGAHDARPKRKRTRGLQKQIAIQDGW